MATVTPSMVSSSITESELDETSVISSLARLQQMHASLRRLRETVPRVMDSVLVDPSSPEQLYSHFSQAAMGAANDIKEFGHLMDQKKSKEVLEKAKESRAKDAEGITGWIVSAHGDWLDMKKEEDSDDPEIDGEGKDTAVSAMDTNPEDMQAVVEKFKESHPGIEASFDTDFKTVKVFLPSPAHIHFEIQPITTDSSSSFSVKTVEKTKLHKAMVEAITPRLNSLDAKSLLDMLYSYNDLKSRPCTKCSRLLDLNAKFPVVRSKKRTKQAGGQYEYHWEAYHLACT
ncbi:hypothetical protein N7G274_000580 [Stereocaulon virgatum]|uniref:Mediator of RNA polymerase II transcription subunit 27 n=1 Tax=Stereocaulon virgatum TaxID=373712 RepID=A0ABR4AYU8_9LECA